MYTNRVFVLDITKPPRTFQLLTWPTYIEYLSVLHPIRQSNCFKCEVRWFWPTSSNSFLIDESFIFSGKFVTYSVDFHAKCTVTSWLSIRFLSFVSAARTLSLGDFQRQSFQRKVYSYFVRELNSSNWKLFTTTKLYFSDFATLGVKLSICAVSQSRKSTLTSRNKFSTSLSFAVNGR